VFIGCAGCLIHAQEYEQEYNFPIRLPKWVNDFSLRTGAGYRDNVGLSAKSPQDSPFVATGLEMILLRLPENGTEFSFFANVEDLRFVSSSLVNKEQTAVAQALVKTDCGSGWLASLSTEYLYQNQVVDVSLTEPGLTTIPVEGHGLTVREGLRRDFEGIFSVSLELPAKRQLFREPLDDYWEYGPRVTVGKSYGHKSELGASYEISERDYDHDQLRTPLGSPVSGSRRKAIQQEARLTWRHLWDAAGRWRTTTRVTARQSEDNGSGYFDYTRLQVSEQILFHTGNWDISAEARAARYDYSVQTVSTVDLTKRQAEEFSVNFRCERRITGFLKVFSEFEHERVSSNLDYERYTVNTVKGGFTWVF
jgi:hypothetical protein